MTADRHRCQGLRLRHVALLICSLVLATTSFNARAGEHRFTRGQVELYKCSELGGEPSAWVTTPGDETVYFEGVRFIERERVLWVEVEPWDVTPSLRRSMKRASQIQEEVAGNEAVYAAGLLSPLDKSASPNFGAENGETELCVKQSTWKAAFTPLPIQQKSGVQVFALTVPLKVRVGPRVDVGGSVDDIVEPTTSAPQGITATSSVSGLLGVAWEGRISKREKQSVVLGGAFGMSAETLSYNRAAGGGEPVSISVTRPALNAAVTPGIRLGSLDFFVPLGVDLMLGPDSSHWSEQGRLWLGFGLGLSGKVFQRSSQAK